MKLFTFKSKCPRCGSIWLYEARRQLWHAAATCRNCLLQIMRPVSGTNKSEGETHYGKEE